MRPISASRQLPKRNSEISADEGWETRRDFLWIEKNQHLTEVQTQPNLPDLQVLSLDWYSLGDVLRGYQSEVLPELKQKVDEPPLKNIVDGVFPAERFVSPFRDLPDIYMRSALRAEVWAALLANKQIIQREFWGIDSHSDRIVIVASTKGATGSAWAREISLMLRQHAPKADVFLFLIHVDHLPIQTGTVLALEANLKAAYCVTELGDLDDERIHVWLTRVPDFSSSFAAIGHRIRSVLVNDEFREYTASWATDMNEIMWQASQSLMQLAATPTYPQWRQMANRARSLSDQRKFRCACLAEVRRDVDGLMTISRCEICGLELVV